MQSNNFKFLQSSWPQLYESASSAEAYLHINPGIAIIKLRCFAEQLVGIIYRDLSLPCEQNDNFFKKITSIYFERIISKDIIEKFHSIRMLSNKVIYREVLNLADAFALLREVHLISRWVYELYSESEEATYLDYVEPAYPVNKNNHKYSDKERQDQFIQAREDLFSLIAFEKSSCYKSFKIKGKIDKPKFKDFRKASIIAESKFNLSSNKARNSIRLNDAFSEYKLTGQQALLVNKLDQFLNSDKEGVFILKGHIGTGKGFIAKGVTEYFRAVGRNYILTASTVKAAKIIANKTRLKPYFINRIFHTSNSCHNYIYCKKGGSNEVRYYAELQANNMPSDTVFIVYESSMISDSYIQDGVIRLGSGYFLKDFLEFLNINHKDHRNKVIFIGDDTQLPPVGMSFIPALDQKYLYREYNVECAYFQLTETFHKTSETGIAANSLQLYKSIKYNDFNRLPIDTNFPDIIKVSEENLLNAYLKSCDGKINAESIIIAQSHFEAAAYNNKIRQHFFPKASGLAVFDIVIAVHNSNCQGDFISTGELGLVTEVSNATEYRQVTLYKKNPETNQVEERVITLAFRDVSLGVKDFSFGHRELNGRRCLFSARIIENVLYSEHAGLTSDESEALYVDFCNRNKHLKPGSEDFIYELGLDPNFNALRLKFGYALTCQNAQGRKWNNVFVQCKTHQDHLTADYFRWLYTAITRTSKKLYLVDLPDTKDSVSIGDDNPPK